MPDQVDWQDLSTVQSGLQPKPRTIAASTTIAPTTFLTRISGTTAVSTITPPMTGSHMLAVVAGATNGIATTGNIVGASTNAASTTTPMLMVYDPVTATYIVNS
jgi:hypothetical protein